MVGLISGVNCGLIIVSISDLQAIPQMFVDGCAELQRYAS